jgi:hypothetical protein
MTPEQEASVCTACLLTAKADCLTCKFFSDFPPTGKNYLPATAEDIFRIFRELHGDKLP